jgi:hypothetical protein
MASVYIADGVPSWPNASTRTRCAATQRDGAEQLRYVSVQERYKDAAQHLKIAANDPSYSRRGQAYEIQADAAKLNQPAEAEQSFCAH